MPFAPRRPCTHPGCPVLVEKGNRCEKHKGSANSYDRFRENSNKRGYDSAWRRLRDQILKRDEFICQQCLKEDRIVPAEHVDHVEPFEGKDDPKRLDPQNLQSLCQPCHSRKTAMFDGGFGNLRKATNGERT